MMKRYDNSFHLNDQLSKTASVYERQSLSNREQPKSREVYFPALSPSEANDIKEKMSKEAHTYNEFHLEKAANITQKSPFDLFATTKNYIAHKLGLSDDVAHDMASSIIGQAQNLQNVYGGDLNDKVTGIIDNMNPSDVQKRIGASSMKSNNSADVEEHAKQDLISEMGLSDFQAEQAAKIVVKQAKDLKTIYRNKTISDIATAILKVIVEHHDVSVVYSVNSSAHLKQEISHFLDQTEE